MYRTKLNIETKQAFTINHQSQIMTIGSCFSQNIGLLLQKYKFDCHVNPFGILYNPVSIKNILDLCLNQQTLPDDLYVNNQEIWSHYWLHSQHASLCFDTLKDRLDKLIIKQGEILQNTDYLLVTLGTAYVYESKKHECIVANCHKSPSVAFEKRLLSVQEVTKSLEKIRKVLPNRVKIIYSLSPIRHTKEGLENNCLSKSILRTALAEHTQKNKNTCYFPAYELLIDDLRDYRYYEKDLIHPNELAIEYIWDSFKSCFLDNGTKSLLKKIVPLLKASEHKAFFPETLQHQTFLKKTIDKMQCLEGINFREEIASLKKQLMKDDL